MHLLLLAIRLIVHRVTDMSCPIDDVLQVLGSYINPGGHIPPNFFSDISTEEVSLTSDCVKSQGLFFPATVPVLLTQSCLVPAISSYLHNDSVMDMARHIPLYRALLQLLKGEECVFV